jgi:hypothetical protein
VQTTYLPQRNAEGEVIGLSILANDVSDLKQKQMQLDTLAVPRRAAVSTKSAPLSASLDEITSS